ncbi:DUF1552 domain-containing protein [Stratiformator vulcanicus]|uniref:DUF1552 domain-containing protein n=1 Tax=Stratiformator vulcanicus TaxID=2527980 RepID=A0A517R5F0_9PLAN|nr:DUF1552 domain-containing protein [Stratiformator vulcanicus]QDT39118.1 hypothetical protein Pan189_35200 [Stratiformator vulcanicus]
MALPWLDAMTPRAAASATDSGVPLRMGIFTVTGGTVLESWRPDYEGKLDALPSILRPLEPHKDDMLILSGLSHHGKAKGLNAHENCAYVHLTGAPEVTKVDGKANASVSIDQLVAQNVGHNTFLPSLEIGTSNHEQKYSFKSKTEPVPYESNPKLIFERMFTGRRPVAPNWSGRADRLAQLQAETKKSNSLDQSVLDLVMEDAKRLQRRVGKADRRTMEQYMESVRSVERRVAMIEAQGKLMAADGAGDLVPIPELLTDSKINWGDLSRSLGSDPEPHAQYIEVMADLMVLAFQTDSTRVVTCAVGSDGAQFPGVVTVGFERHAHTLEHNGNARKVEDADPIAREGCRQIHAWYTAQFARIIEKMKGIDEGGSSLLDNTMLLYTSYMSNGGHGRTDYPVMLVGNAQGTLQTGRHVAYPKKTPMSNLYVEMADRMGVPVSEFGESLTSPAASFNGRLPSLV